jgi:4a-hydroxytetrahydrobiopterin dehydratase
LERLADQLGGGWQVVDEHHIEKEFRFADFREALDFTNRLGEIAEMEGHHPEILLSWGKVLVTIFTHKVDGLTESDFILAAKCEQCCEVAPNCRTLQMLSFAAKLSSGGVSYGREFESQEAWRSSRVQ